MEDRDARHARGVDCGGTEGKSSKQRRLLKPRASQAAQLSQRRAAARLTSEGTQNADSHVAIMDATEFGRFHKWMTNPKRPSKAMIEAAKLHRLLVSKS
jgi:hypothetical protein